MARAPEGRTADGEAPKRPWWTADRNPKAATCSREQAPSSLDMSALRSHVVERREGATPSLSAGPQPGLGLDRSATMAGARSRVGHHGGRRTTRHVTFRCPATDFEQVPGTAQAARYVSRVVRVIARGVGLGLGGQLCCLICVWKYSLSVVYPQPKLQGARSLSSRADRIHRCFKCATVLLL